MARAERREQIRARVGFFPTRYPSEMVRKKRAERGEIKVSRGAECAFRWGGRDHMPGSRVDVRGSSFGATYACLYEAGRIRPKRRATRAAPSSKSICMTPKRTRSAEFPARPPSASPPRPKPLNSRYNPPSHAALLHRETRLILFHYSH